MELAPENATREELLKYISIQDQRFSELEKSRDSEIAALKSRIAWFERQVFGVKSERLIPQDPKQTNFLEVPEEPPLESTSVKSYERDARKSPTSTDDESPVRFDDSVPVDEETILPKEVKGLSKSDYEVIGQKVTERLVQIPTQYRVKKTIRLTCKLKESQELVTAPAPDAVIERSLADVSFLVGMLVDKFLYHLPLYRQHQRLIFSGVHISRGHLTKLSHRTLELLEPVYQAILSEICMSEVVSMDETPIKAGRKSKGKMNTGYFWPVYAEEQVAFVYSSTRAHRVVSEVLGKGCKKLVSDGYSAYERYAEAREETFVHAQCWAHVRRKFFDAAEHSPKEAEEALELIKKLFLIERELEGKAPEKVMSLRREKSQVLVDQFFKFVDLHWFTLMADKTSLLGKALSYAQKREESLRQFLLHPDLPISNNHVERAIRPVAVGRKNWLFCWSEVGAKYSAIAFTLIECCKMQGVNPWEYLNDILVRIDSHPAKDVQLLTPKNWKQNFQT